MRRAFQIVLVLIGLACLWYFVFAEYFIRWYSG